MNINSEIKSNIHLYVILELAIKSLQHDQKLFESFTVKRPYLSLCERQIEILKDEFQKVKRALLKQGVKYENYEVVKKNECMYYFLCRGEIIPFHYHGELLKKQVERKIQLTWSNFKGDSQHESIRNNEIPFR
ncbi:hypothetical protein SAMN05877842_113101 [Ureibacillus acetophenoni]|uniref:Uncharacterized protein n=1 Tax=Ureibacillus acetophenoni TaxID=614649 RepID=A0A285UR64_9BACL|nr:hypothetical protein SAMN05877842_113101 [Ureibacillus acetophenoni]